MFVKVAFVLGSMVAGAFYGTTSPKSTTPNVKCSVFRDALKKKVVKDEESITCSVVAVPAQSVTGTLSPQSAYVTPQQPIRKYSSLQTSGGSNYATPSAPPMPVDLVEDPNSTI